METTALVGLAVVAITEGAKLGYVNDVLIDPQAMRLAALRVNANGQDFIIPFGQIASLGSDAVTVESSQASQVPSPGDQFSQLPGLNDFKRLKVVDEAGTYLGMVSGIELDTASGQLSDFQVQKGGILGLGAHRQTIPCTAVRRIGPELITVASDGQTIH